MRFFLKISRFGAKLSGLPKFLVQFWCNSGATGMILCILERQNRKVWLHQKSAKNGLNRWFLGKRIAFHKNTESYLFGADDGT